MQETPKHTTTWRIHDVVAFVMVIGVFFVIVWLSHSRHYFGFATETDFLSHIIQDAENFMEGRPLLVLYHPPFYPILLALFQLVFDDWFSTGRLVSILSSAVVLLTTYLLFRSSISAAAGVGAVAALVISPVFIAYSTFASSDIFFLALYSSALLIAYLSDRSQSVALWTLTGIIVGLALLTRTNAITLLLLLGIPLLSGSSNNLERLRCLGFAFAGVLIPVIAWYVFAQVSKSNLLPGEGTTVNLALNYFKPNDIKAWADGREFAQENFGSVWDVIARDPVHVAKEYAKDLYRAIERLLGANTLIAFPGIYFAMPAVLALLFHKHSRWLVYVVLLGIAQFLLVNLKSFEPRFYLFLLAPIGALTAEFIRNIYYEQEATRNVPESVRRFGSAILILVFLVSTASSVFYAHKVANRDEAEVGDSVPKALQFIPAGSRVVARKPVLAFYASSDHVFLPKGASIDDLLEFLAVLKAGTEEQVFLYYGSQEERTRPEYSALAEPDLAAFSFDTLSVVTLGTDTVEWVLFEYRDINKE